MLDHVTIGVSDLAKSQVFYDAALAPLGMSCVHADGERFAGYGPGTACFWIGVRRGGPTHVAFVAQTRDDVRRFYDAALAHGGRDNGAPGLRPHYHPDYYGAFVLDPDGHNIEAVCRRPA